jgi:hypothetical protein
MTKDEIIGLAQEAGIGYDWSFDFHMRLERFAGLIAAADREECADLVEQMGIEGYGTLVIAAAIRARGEK